MLKSEMIIWQGCVIMVGVVYSYGGSHYGDDGHETYILIFVDYIIVVIGGGGGGDGGGGGQNIYFLRKKIIFV